MFDLIEKLRAPFPPEIVSWRVGSTNKRAWEQDKNKPKRGQVLAYIDARDVMQRLDEVVGPFSWQSDNVPMSNGTTCCRIGIRHPETGEWVWKSDGAGATGNIDNENEREMAQKGGYSDALKRAAVLWGIGQYLYDVEAPWIVLDDFWKIPKTELPALQRLLTGEKAPSANASRKTGEFQRIEKELRACITLKALAAIWKNNQDVIAAMAAGYRQSLTEEKDRIKATMEEELARA